MKSGAQLPRFVKKNSNLHYIGNTYWSPKNIGLLNQMVPLEIQICKENGDRSYILTNFGIAHER
jgi:hypothetical protein